MRKANFMSGILAMLGLLVLILDSQCAIAAAGEAVSICLNTIIPSLLPFLFLTTIITASFTGASNRFIALAGKMLYIPEGMESILIPAFLGGYPTGAYCLGECYRNRVLSKHNAERMLAFCSNAGPSFLFGITAAFFSSKAAPWLCWFVQLISAYTAAMLLPHADSSKASPNIQKISAAAALTASISSMAKICGWILLFRVLIAFLDRWFLWIVPAWLRVLIIGFLDLSNGCFTLNAVSSEPLRFVICNVILSLGGLCVLMQTTAAIGSLSLRFYVIGKLFQCTSSAVLSASIAYGFYAIPVAFIAVLVILRAVSEKKSSISAPIVV